MILIALFIFFLLIENILLPALIGPAPIFIIPLFALAIIVYGRNLKLSIFQAILFIFISELFSGARILSFVIPFAITTGLYIWLNKFLNIDSGLAEGRFFGTMLGGIFVLSLSLYFYSYLFLLLDTSHGALYDWDQLKILFKSSILETVIWSGLFGILFKYAPK